MIAAGVGMTARHHNVTSCGRACSYLMSKCGKCAGLMFPLFRRHSTSVPALPACLLHVPAPVPALAGAGRLPACLLHCKSLRVPAPAPCRRVSSF